MRGRCLSRQAATRRLVASAGLVALASSCFSGAYLLGEPCVTDRECAPMFLCQDGVCGGQESESESETSGTTADEETTASEEAVCGDGVPQLPEQCDDGNDDDHDACTNACTLAYCGDGVVGQGEECDDGDGADDNSCTNACTLAVCGDGLVSQGEECDDGNAEEHDACLNACTAARCGDGVIWVSLDPEENEECDDGNEDDDDACANNCAGARLISSVAVGLQHTCVVHGTGRVRCWGDNSFGQLGYPLVATIGQETTPADAYEAFAPGLEADVELGAGVKAIVAGEQHSCALGFDGGVRCWGKDGRLGYGETEPVGDDETPDEFYSGLEGGGVVPILQGANVVQLTAGRAHTCALLENQEVRCWGSNQYGQLGYGEGELGGAVDLGTERVVDEVVAGDWHTCVKLEVGPDEPGEIRCWGRNTYGQLGYGDLSTMYANPSDPSIGLHETPGEFYAAHDIGPVGYLAGDETYRVSHLAAGEYHTCALLDPDAVRCWGNNNHGQLGYGANDVVGSTVGLHETPAEYYATLDAALTQLTFGNVQLRQPISGLGVERISAGAHHTCVVLSDNTVRCWGRDDLGQLGYGSAAVDNVGDDETPLDFYLEQGSDDFEVSVSVGDRVNDIATAREHNCTLLTHGGRVRCWGRGDQGRLGYGNDDDIGEQTTPLDYYKQQLGGNGDVQVF
ncbi:MAG: hypothetical protein H6713_03475 [Myxococcales bacterium]|nr:hypothetical protein [Myxococcales bacterium]